MRYLAPDRLTTRIINPLLRRTGLVPTLVVDRRSGSGAGSQAVPVNVLIHRDVPHVVSMRGESRWVRNLRAAGRCELRRRFHRRTYRAEEVAPRRARNCSPPTGAGGFRRRRASSPSSRTPPTTRSSG